METLILESLRQQARNAYYWSSFHPEKRGDQDIAAYSEELTADIEIIRKSGESHSIDPEVLESSVLRYSERYKRHLSAYFGSLSNCASAMITGPANFPLRQQEKRHQWADNKYQFFREWREKCLNAICKGFRPKKTISGELERCRVELEGLKRNHELMKEGNKRIKDSKKTGEDLTEYLTTTFGIQPHMIEWTMKWGFGLSNNLANIKRIEQSIKILEAKESRIEEKPEIEFDGGKVVVNFEADRIQILFDSKPNAEKIGQLKRGGFRWSPSFGAWQRNNNGNSKYAVNRVLNTQIFKGY